MLEKILQEFGLNKKEIAVYIACLEWGPAFASHIAKKAKLNRSTCYMILEDLIKRGLITKYGAEKKYKFTAENPEKIVLLIKEKKGKIENLEKKLVKILPELKSIFDKTEDLPKIKFLEGVESVKGVYEDTLNSIPRGGEYWHFNPDIVGLKKMLGQKWIEDLVKRRMSKSIGTKVIVEDNSEAQADIKKDRFTKRETVLLPKTMKMPVRLHIYANKVAIFSLKEEPVGVLIEDQNITDMMRLFFKALWDKYKTPASKQ
ncbi:MAG: helix-turn-helix domain-containing protein [Candidatus Pacebacteria bacterium]|nr:helix-turn-helix domain-containing protein [Candidatus Paceibacterota bacterium]